MLLLLDGERLCVCGLCLGASVSHWVCFFCRGGVEGEGVRSCFVADAEHKDALSGEWTIGQVWRCRGGRGLHTNTHTHKFLGQRA